MMEKCKAVLLNPAEVLVTGPPSLKDWRESQRVFKPGAEYSSQYKRGLWDGYYSAYKYCRQRDDNLWEFRASRGMLGRLAKAYDVRLVANGKGFAPDLQQRIEAWSKDHPILQKFCGDRDYQYEATLSALTAQWGRVALATNAGKGAVIAALCDFAIQQGVPVLVLCDEVAVFDALTEEIYKWAGVQPAHVTQGVRTPPTGAPVTVAMVPTVARRIGGVLKKKKKGEKKVELTAAQKVEHALWRKWLCGFGMVLVDEADKATAQTWRNVLLNTKGSHWRVGFSGTFPDPAEQPYEDLRLDELMGRVLISAKNIEMIQRKVSAIPQVLLHSYDVTAGLITARTGFWRLAPPQQRQRIYELAIVENEARHAFIASLLSANPTAVVVNRVAHARALAAALPGAVFLDGSCSVSKRNEVLGQFQRGEVQVLVVTKILDRGTNKLGTAADLIFASGEGSTRQTLQRIGRGLRRTGGKEYLRLIDVIDRVDVGTSRSTYLNKAARFLHKAARKRVQLYQDEGFEVAIMEE